MRSQAKLAAAYAAGQIQPDLVPVAVRDADGAWGLATADEPPRPGTTLDGVRDLETPFRPHGRVTAATPSPLTDGATGCLVAAEEVAAELGLPVGCGSSGTRSPASTRRSWASARSRPPRRLLARLGLTIDDIGLIEINEAFAVQVLAFLDHFGIADDDPRVNPWGGAIAVGHPLAVLRRPADDPARAPVRRAPRRPLRHDHDVRRARPGRHGRLGEPALAAAYRRVDAARREPSTATSTRRARARRPGARRRAATTRCRHVALVTLDNGHDHTPADHVRPAGLAALRRGARRGCAARDDLDAVAVTGKPFVFAVGADLDAARRPARAATTSLAVGALGHAVFGRLAELAVPTFAFVNGAGDRRRARAGAALRLPHGLVRRAGVALPEVFLGLVPGWGGA